jgi:hypothetical protein
VKTFIISLLSLTAASSLAPAGAAPALLLDDFSGTSSPMGAEWKAFSDRVMGGISTVAMGMTEDGGRRALEMSGSVSTANNGGFIQVRLDLTRGGAALNAAAYTGIRLLVKGNGPGYYLHVRTPDTFLPWQYYSAPLALNGEWQTLDVPFSGFTPQALGKKLNTGKLKSLALVAAKGNFPARALLGGVWLY